MHTNYYRPGIRKADANSELVHSEQRRTQHRDEWVQFRWFTSFTKLVSISIMSWYGYDRQRCGSTKWLWETAINPSGEKISVENSNLVPAECKSDYYTLLSFQILMDSIKYIKINAIRSSETVVVTYNITRCHNPEYHNRHFHSHGILKFHRLPSVYLNRLMESFQG